MNRGLIRPMQGFRSKSRIAAVVAVTAWIGLAAIYGLLKPISNGCIMTYMYPTYIPISETKDQLWTKYGLYLYHEGWKKIDFNEHIKKLSGVPVLFIPGNGGSYKQARSSFIFSFAFSWKVLHLLMKGLIFQVCCCSLFLFEYFSVE